MVVPVSYKFNYFYDLNQLIYSKKELFLMTIGNHA